MRDRALLLRQGCFIATVVGLIWVTVITVRPGRTKALKPDAQLEQQRLAKLNAERFHALVRRGAGTEISFASANDSREKIQASIDSVTDFIRNRSGLELGRAAKQRLTVLEAQALQNNTQRITADELTDALNQTLIERLRTLTDAEIEHAAETFRGFAAPGLPEATVNGRRMAKLRANGEHQLPPAEFIAQAKNIRRHLATPALFLSLLAQSHELVKPVVEKRLGSLSAAAPEQWGQAKTKGVTPAQAFLIAYSTASDDYLWYAQADLHSMMRSAHQLMARRLGRFPSFDGHYAYGVNGYLYSAPLDLLFDERTTERLLDRLKQRSAQ